MAQDVEYVKPNGVPVYIYMNNNATNFVNVYGDPQQITDESFYSTGSNDYASQWGTDNIQYYFPNGMASAAIAFSDGMYKQSAYGLIASEDDAMRIGVKGNSSQWNDSWVIWDDFKLIYRGFNPDVIKPVLETAMEDAQGYLNLLMGKTEYAALSTAFADAETAIENNDGEAMFAALNALYNAKDPARISKDIFVEADVATDTLRLANLIRYMSDEKLSKQTLDDAKALLESICKNERYESDEIDLLKDDVELMIDSLNISNKLYIDFIQAIEHGYSVADNAPDDAEGVSELIALLEMCVAQFEEGSISNGEIPEKIEFLNSKISAIELPMMRDALLTFISQAGAITDIGKTEASFSALQNTIERVSSYDVEELVEEEIIQLCDELSDAINNLELLPGYTYLTKEMFKKWDKCDAAIVTEQGNGYAAYDLMYPTDLVYGDINVNEYKFADLSDYDYLYITTYEGSPRVMMNRTEANGQFNEDKELSKMIEMPKDGTWTDAYYTKSDDNKLFTYDLAKIVEEHGFAHLNAIKGAYLQDVSVLEMLLFKNKRLNIDETGLGTFCSVASLDFSAVEGVKAYVAAQFIKDASTIIMTRLTEVPAGTGVYIKGTPGTYSIPLSTSSLYCTNMLKGFIMDTPVSSYDSDMANYYYSSHANSFIHVSNTMVINANTAILQLPASLMNGAESRPIKMLFDDEDATAIETLLKEAGESGNVYDLQGRQVSNPQRGLYIKNGKKIVIK